MDLLLNLQIKGNVQLIRTPGFFAPCPLPLSSKPSSKSKIHSTYKPPVVARERELEELEVRRCYFTAMAEFEI